jgi:rare lipoprotein A
MSIVPRLEPLRTANMRPYEVMGQSFTPLTQLRPYRARGTATWYGRRYHGRPTSSGEIYDMYAISAAHPTLPIPSYARVTNLTNGRTVVVRINDRGPFIGNRLIDLSYAAAHRIGLIASGSAPVEVEAIIPESAQGEVTVAKNADTPHGKLRTPATGLTRFASRPPLGAGAARPVAAPEADPLEAFLAASDGAPSAAPASADRTAVASFAGYAAHAPGAAVYLQLGAFGSPENAEAYLARARAQLMPLSASFRVADRDGLYRVLAGPYGSAAEARAESGRIAALTGVAPILIVAPCPPSPTRTC